MSASRNLTGKQFGPKIQELFHLMDTIKDWEQYVPLESIRVVKKLYELKNMTDTSEELDMKYVTVREHCLRAARRIKEKKLDYLRDGRSQLAQRLFDLMDREGWQTGLTEYEIALAEKFREVKSFYELARQLNLVPGNIAATLYGSTQKLGVISKIERNFKLKQKVI
jgi:DNA-binding NarL/FixJ family response regulator